MPTRRPSRMQSSRYGISTAPNTLTWSSASGTPNSVRPLTAGRADDRSLCQGDGCALFALRAYSRRRPRTDLDRRPMGGLYALRAQQRSLLARADCSPAHDLADLLWRGGVLSPAPPHERLILRGADADEGADDIRPACRTAHARDGVVYDRVRLKARAGNLAQYDRGFSRVVGRRDLSADPARRGDPFPVCYRTITVRGGEARAGTLSRGGRGAGHGHRDPPVHDVLLLLYRRADRLFTRACGYRRLPLDWHPARGSDAEDFRRRLEGRDADDSLFCPGRRHHGRGRNSAAHGGICRCGGLVYPP